MEQRRFGEFFGYLPQNVSLLPGTVADNIGRFGKFSDDDIIDAAKRARVHDLILRLPKGYETPLDEGLMFSGGQRQLIALARAIIGQPAVVDPRRAQLQPRWAGRGGTDSCIRDLKERGTTVILITHRPNLVVHLDHAAVLRDGMMVSFGSTTTSSSSSVGRRSSKNWATPMLETRPAAHSPPKPFQDSAFGPVLVGGVAALVLIAAVTGWSSTMSVASRPPSRPGKVAAEGNRKAVQHPTGGEVGAVFVREGQLVEKGQKLLQLELADAKAEATVLSSARAAALFRAARLQAERADAADIAFPDACRPANDPQVQLFFQQELASVDGPPRGLSGPDQPAQAAD